MLDKLLNGDFRKVEIEDIENEVFYNLDWYNIKGINYKVGNGMGKSIDSINNILENESYDFLILYRDEYGYINCGNISINNKVYYLDIESDYEIFKMNKC